MGEWKESKIEELPLTIGDGNYSSKYPKASDFILVGIPFISNKDIKQGRILPDGLRYISKEKHSELLKGHIRTNDVLISTRANIGDIAYVAKEYDDANINAQLVFLRTDEDTISSRFLFYLLISTEYRTLFESYASGSAQMQLPIWALLQIPIRYPSIAEQRAIASVLSSLDDKIDLLHRQNRTLEKLAETLFRQWFVEEVHDKIPLGEVAEVGTGKGLKREEFIDEGGHPILGANGEIGRTNKCLTEERLILTGRVGTLGKVYITEGKVWISDNVLIIKPTSDLYFYPIYFSLKSFDFENLNVGSTQPLVTQTDLKNIELPLPNDDVLRDYLSHCKGYFEKVSENKAQIRTLTQMRDTLLPNLMSGEVRVRGLQIAVNDET